MKNKMNIVIGIDPGKNGAIAVYNLDSKRLLALRKMPETPKDLLMFFKIYSNELVFNSIVFLEKVHGMPGQSGPAMFNFGKNYGNIEMAIIASKIRYMTVTPQKWQKFYQLGGKGKQTTTQWKNKLKEKSQSIFPDIKIFLWGADALLITYWGSKQK